MPISAAEPLLLEVQGAASAGYGKIAVLHGVDLASAPGEVVALLGPNGAGKTTLLRAVSGLLPWTAGSVRFDGRDMRGAGPRGRPRAGPGARDRGPPGLHPADRHRQPAAGRLRPAARRARRRASRRRWHSSPRSPPSAHERGGALSGGQQQMLAVAQGLVRRPRLLMLDEPSAGLSPVLVDRVLGVVGGCAKPAPRCCWSSS